MPSQVPVPGTVHLVDLDGSLNARHGKSRNDIVLLPQPSSDPDDPLNWSPMRKFHNTFWQYMWTFVGSCLCSCLSPAYNNIVSDTGISLENINTGQGIMYLGFGWGCLITQPLAINYGRRPVLVLSLLVFSLFTLWTAYIDTVGVWYLNRVLSGIAYSPIESLIELCVADTRFTHERGFHMGFYCWALFGGGALVPIASGIIAEQHGWRWINYTACIIGCAVSLLMFFFFEETMFYRPKHVPDELVIEGVDTLALPTRVENGEVEEALGSEKSRPPTPTEKKDSTMQRREILAPRKTFLQKMKMWDLRDPRQPFVLFKLFFLPFVVMQFPAVLFSGMLIGSILSWYQIFVGTLNLILGEDPYNFTSESIGYFYIAVFIGVTIGCAFSGWLSDILAERLARRNGGVKEPEARLWMALIPMILHPAGSILYGVGAAHHIHWVGIAFGLGFACVGVVMGSTIALTYVVDCYKEVAGETLISVILFRNTIGFAFIYAILPMVDSMGLQGAFILIAFLGVGFWATCFLFIWKGKQMRQWLAQNYWNMVEKYGLSAH
ncbi:major facilitator superfamily domain-containing protein [Aspergillus varians]